MRKYPSLSVAFPSFQSYGLGSNRWKVWVKSGSGLKYFSLKPEKLPQNELILCKKSVKKLHIIGSSSMQCEWIFAVETADKMEEICLFNWKGGFFRKSLVCFIAHQ